MTRMKAAGFTLGIADCLTFLNLAAGVLAIHAVLAGERGMAAALVGAGLIFDFLDGRVARATGQASRFGTELDSLADLVTFGVAPGLIALSGQFGMVAGLLFALAAGARLARFNVSTTRDRFEGLPVPAAAVLLIAPSFTQLPSLAISAWAILLAFLMVSRIEVPKP